MHGGNTVPLPVSRHVSHVHGGNTLLVKDRLHVRRADPNVVLKLMNEISKIGFTGFQRWTDKIGFFETVSAFDAINTAGMQYKVREGLVLQCGVTHKVTGFRISVSDYTKMTKTVSFRGWNYVGHSSRSNSWQRDQSKAQLTVTETRILIGLSHDAQRETNF